MDNTRPTLHPALWVAAASVTALSLAGVGALTGVLPFNHKSGEQPVAAVAQPAAAVAPPTAVPPAPTVAVNIANSPAAPVAKAAASRPVRVARSQEPSDIEVIRHEPAPAQIRTAAPAVTPAPAPTICRDCGTIEAVREVARETDGSGLGAVAGGVLGGVLGNQVGNGRGRDLATVAGVIGGAIAGNQIEKTQKRVMEYQVTVRFEDGTSRVFTQDSPPVWRSGDRVRVENGVIASRA